MPTVLWVPLLQKSSGFLANFPLQAPFPLSCFRRHFKKITVISCLKEKADVDQRISCQNLSCFGSAIFELWLLGIKWRRKLERRRVLMTLNVLGTSSLPSRLISRAIRPRNCVKFIMRCTMFTRKGINFANQYMEFIVLAVKGTFDKLLSSDLDPLKDPSQSRSDV